MRLCPKCHCSKVVRLSIAQVLTVIRQTQKKTLREAYATKARTSSAALSTARILLCGWASGSSGTLR